MEEKEDAKHKTIQGHGNETGYRNINEIMGKKQKEETSQKNNPLNHG